MHFIYDCYCYLDLINLHYKLAEFQLIFGHIKITKLYQIAYFSLGLFFPPECELHFHYIIPYMGLMYQIWYKKTVCILYFV